jgi:hypothetical protein
MGGIKGSLVSHFSVNCHENTGLSQGVNLLNQCSSASGMLAVNGPSLCFIDGPPFFRHVGGWYHEWLIQSVPGGMCQTSGGCSLC